MTFSNLVPADESDRLPYVDYIEHSRTLNQVAYRMAKLLGRPEVEPGVYNEDPLEMIGEIERIVTDHSAEESAL